MVIEGFENRLVTPGVCRSDDHFRRPPKSLLPPTRTHASSVASFVQPGKVQPCFNPRQEAAGDSRIPRVLFDFNALSFRDTDLNVRLYSTSTRTVPFFIQRTCTRTNHGATPELGAPRPEQHAEQQSIFMRWWPVVWWLCRLNVCSTFQLLQTPNYRTGTSTPNMLPITCWSRRLSPVVKHPIRRFSYHSTTP